ncbi:hypothetical protein J6O48_07300 [bacterium]|nr:hypothetical protein [bacterium]
MKLIDKDAVVTELERLYDLECNNTSNLSCGKKIILRHILLFLDTLEVKEVDLEKEIKNGIYNLSNLYCYMEDLFNGNEEEGVYPIPENVKNELFEFAKHFFELGLKAKRE